METITVEWDGVLRMLATTPPNLKFAEQPVPAVGIATLALATPARVPIPIELVLTPTFAAGLLALLRDLESEGKIPRNIVQSVRTSRH